MKIALIAGSFPNARCGIGDYTAHLATGLASQGIETYVVTTDQPEIKALDQLHLKVVKSIPSWRLFYLPRFLRSLHDISPDLVHVQYPTRGYRHHLLVNVFPVILRLFLNKAVLVVTLHEFSIAHWLRKAGLFFLLWLSNAIVVPDEREKRSLLRWSGHLGSRCRVIPIGANIEPVSNPLPGSESPVKEPYIVYFGFSSKSKDLYVLLRAFHEVIKSSISCRLMMMTELSPRSKERQEFQDLLNRWDLAGRVTITGYRSPEEVSRCLSGAALCVLPFSDGVSWRRTTFLSALKHGLPTVTTHGPEIPDGLVNWENVVLCPIGDSLAMARVIVRLLSEPGMRETLSRNARILSERFSWPMIVKEHRALYQSILEGTALNEDP